MDHMSAFHLHLDMDVTMGPMESDGHRSLHLHSLRIQLPEHLESVEPKKEKPVEKKRTGKKGEQEKRQEDEDDGAEYVAVSPLFTWSDEHARSMKQDQFGELLWPIVLRSYGLTESSSRTFSTYRSFRDSVVARHPERYPHHSLRGLMEWYIEEHLPVLKRNTPWTMTEKENLTRRMLLRQRFMAHQLVWAPEYMEMYQTWSTGCQAGMNRYQKMEKFIATFFL
jgi:hypothetical protein